MNTYDGFARSSDFSDSSKVDYTPSDLLMDRIYTGLIRCEIPQMDHYMSDGIIGKGATDCIHYTLRFHLDGQDYLAKGNNPAGFIADADSRAYI